MTDWICIATEGETVDGRSLDAQWLIDMAESYDPEGIYTALIWPEHERWYGSQGEVLDLKCETVGDLVKLYARLCPERDLIDANRRGQLLFCSVEPTPTLNFRGTGKPYLEGLGVTSSPASIGTDRMRFSAEKNHAIYGALEPLVFSQVTELSEEEMSNGKLSDKKRQFRNLFNIQDKKDKGDDKPDQKPKKSLFSKGKFSDEQVESLVEVVEELLEDNEEQAEVIEEIKGQLTEIKEALDEVKEEVGNEEFSKLKTQLDDAQKKFAKLDSIATQLPDNNPGDKDKQNYAF
ncbi:GPO family capsid scaffolding protein [Lelliottia sp. WB101]|uniref:GPO family capsid scaffolding protein n=1 Tax=Lelliottia sp. WB101 TaxID=2153385 RepID=UPI001F277FDD|nr:GPO family capsid scaffolding protein [Lelliottia sp. WB101]